MMGTLTAKKKENDVSERYNSYKIFNDKRFPSFWNQVLQELNIYIYEYNIFPYFWSLSETMCM